MKEIPIWEKSNLSLEEAAAYSGIGINKLREITNEDRCKFVLWVGNKRLINIRRRSQNGSVALIMHLKFVFCGGVYVAKTLCAQRSVFWCTPK